MAKKQAVVIIHGMGEQRPMETLRSFVKTVWERDKALSERFGYSGEPDNAENKTDAPAATADASQKSSKSSQTTRNAWWIKPDDRAGLAELRRVTTRRLADHDEIKTGRGEGKRTDFFEFYWADLVQGTTLNHLLGWVQSLLLRSPRQVPIDAFAIWISLWLLVAFGSAYLVAYQFNFFGFKVYLLDQLPDHVVIAPLKQFFVSLWENIRSLLWTGAGFYWLCGGLAALAIVKLRPAVVALYKDGFFASNFVWITFGAAAVVCFILWPGISSFFTQGSWIPLLVLFGLFYLNSFLKRYFGDMARYVRAHPDNVELRNNIRERGLALLVELHECGDYDRIVIVAHSQGSIIAYDLISMLWSRVGPGTRNPPSYQAGRQFRVMDNYLRTRVKDHTIPFSLDEYQALQTNICGALGATEFKRDHQTGEIKSSPWLVTDFVTVGSPLSHAEFLLTRDSHGLAELVRERLLPTCPPVLESYEMNPPDKEPGFSEPSFMFRSGTSSSKTYPHHAACFAAVRWTNIYDKPPCHTFVLGDPLSGPVLGNFGASIRVVGGNWKNRVLWRETDKHTGTPTNVGIRDIKVAISDPDTILPARWFTHNKYWQLSEAETGKVPDHVDKLRKAVNLVDYPNVDWSEKATETKP